MRYFFWLLLLFVAVTRVITSQPSYTDGDLVRITTRVTNEPVRYEYSQRLILEGLTVYLDKYPRISYGDNVVVKGTVEKGKLKEPVLIKVEESKGFLYRLRKRLLKVYQENLSGNHAALVAGVTLGSKEAITTSFWEQLKVSGTAHVVVASGFNVTLVANFLINFLILLLERKKAVFLAIIGIWFYTVISGFDAPIIRAAIMGSIAFSAVALGRLNYAWRGLFLSALVMIIWHPDWLTDLGFILSFVATASLMLFERKIYHKVDFLPGMIREDFSTSLAAQLGVAPIIWATFGQFNLLSPVINTIVLWTIVPLTIIGMIGGVIGLFVPVLGKLILLTTYPLTKWFIGVVDFFG